MNIYRTIESETARFRDKTAVVDGEHSLSYGELLSLSARTASLLKTAGVGRSDRVALHIKDSMEYIAASLAVLSISAVIVPVAVEHTKAEVDEVLESISVDWLLFEKDCIEVEGASMIEVEWPSEKEIYLVKMAGATDVHEEFSSLNPAFIRFSSGTTGASKGVVLSHEAIVERTDAADKGLMVTSDDSVLWVLSLSFHFVVTILLFLRRAAKIVLCSSPFPDSLIEGITKHRGTFIYASPFHYNLLTRLDSLSRESFHTIRVAVSTAMKLPGNVAVAFHEKYGVELSEAYGIIEAGLPFINLSSNKEKRSSVGRALPDYEVRIDNADSEGAGQVMIRGKGMFDAYYSPWQKKDDVLINGWFKTGDLGRIDSDGYLTIVGRDKEVINFAGMKVFPQEVEDVINRFPGVRESVLYGEDHPSYGQLPQVKLVLEQSASDSIVGELRKYCYENLAQYKVPKSFEVVEHIEKTASGKIKRV